MVNEPDTATVDIAEAPDPEVATADWQEDFEPSRRPSAGWRSRAALAMTAAVLIGTALTSKLTVDTSADSLQGDSSTTLNMMLSRRRKISAMEARRLALNILAECEARRLQVDREEARRAALLEEEV